MSPVLCGRLSSMVDVVWRKNLHVAWRIDIVTLNRANFCLPILSLGAIEKCRLAKLVTRARERGGSGVQNLVHAWSELLRIFIFRDWLRKTGPLFHSCSSSRCRPCKKGCALDYTSLKTSLAHHAFLTVNWAWALPPLATHTSIPFQRSSPVLPRPTFA